MTTGKIKKKNLMSDSPWDPKVNLKNTGTWTKFI